MKVRLNVGEKTITCLEGCFCIWIQHCVSDGAALPVSLLVTKTIPSSFAPPNAQVSEILDSGLFARDPANTKQFCSTED